MRKVKIKINGKQYFFCPNAFLRIKIWKYRNHICHKCRKIKRLEKSSLFFSDKCNTRYSEKRKRWLYDLNDYIWLCRDCMTKQESISNIIKNDWEKAQNFSYQFN